MAVLFVCVCTAASALVLHALAHESTNDAVIDADVSHVASRLAGRIASIRVENNQFVGMGEPLIELESGDLYAALLQRQAAFRNLIARRSVTETNYDRVQAQAVALKANLAAVKADGISAEANVRKAEEILGRSRKLAKSGSISQQDLQVAITTLDAAKATFKATQERAAEADARQLEGEASVAKAKAEIGELNAQIDQAKAAEAAAQQDLASTRITAPQAGQVTNRSVTRGDYVQVGETLLTIVPPVLWVTANFDESQLRMMRAGQMATILIEAYPGRAFRGHVRNINGGPNSRRKNEASTSELRTYMGVAPRVPVKIVFDDPLPEELTIAPGMSVTTAVTVQRFVYRTETVAGVALLSIMTASAGACFLLRDRKVAAKPVRSIKGEPQDFTVGDIASLDGHPIGNGSTAPKEAIPLYRPDGIPAPSLNPQGETAPEPPPRTQLPAD